MVFRSGISSLRVALPLVLAGSGILMAFLGDPKLKPERRSPNVLFICIDDLRPELGCYGQQHIKSPNLDRLAAGSHLFTRHYVCQPTCGASRYTLLSGRLPHNKAALSNEAIVSLISNRSRTEQAETFIDHLRRNGYYTIGMGKISHYPEGMIYGYGDPVSNKPELPNSWDEFVFNPGRWGTGWNAFFAYADGASRTERNGEVKPYEAADVPDEGYPDGLTAQLAIDKLRALAAAKKSAPTRPFFLGVGFFKPHLPFNAPKKYWDLYDEATLPLTPSPLLPAQVNRASLYNSGEFNQYKLGDEQASLDKPVSDAYARKLRHGYFACISYVDAQVGKVLNELKRLGLDKNTIVVVWGDHGWNLGDYRVWGKHTLFEQSLRSTFMIRTPGMKQGQIHHDVISAVDIYPTLMTLCGVPANPEAEGQNFVNLLNQKRTSSSSRVAYSYFNEGISMRTDRYRLTRYIRAAQPTVELYDHQNDPHENTNVADSHARLIETLLPVWKQGDTGLYNTIESNDK